MRDAQSAADEAPARSQCLQPPSPAQAEQRRYLRGLLLRVAGMVAVMTVVPFVIWRSAMADSKTLDTAHDPSAAASAGALKATLAGGAAMSLGGLTASDAAMWGGLVLGVAGFVLQIILGIRRDRREQREHEARMATQGFYDQG